MSLKKNEAEINKYGLISLIILAGICATSNISKIPAMFSQVQNSFGFSTVAVGYVQACFNLMAILFAVVISFLSRVISPFKLLLVGLGCLIIGNLFGGFSTNALIFILCRLLEGLGFLLIAINAPVCISQSSKHHSRTTALTLWAIYVPGGVSCGLFLTPFLANLFNNWRAMWYFNAIFASILLLLITLKVYPNKQIIPTHQDTVESKFLQQSDFWKLTFAAIIYCFLFFVTMSLISLYLLEHYQVSKFHTGLISASIIASNIPGNLFALQLLKKLPRQVLINIALLIMSILGFISFKFEFSLGWYIGVNCIMIFCAGIIPSLIISSAVSFSHHKNAIAIIQAIFLMGLNIGQFLGPILAGYVFNAFGFSAVGYLFISGIIFLIAFIRL
jgi:predicted MFS family arabinose efflux permease